MRSEGGGQQGHQRYGEEDWKQIGKRTVLERFAIEIFSKDLDRNVATSQSDGFRLSIGRSDGYQEIDDVEGYFAKTATRFQFLKMTQRGRLASARCRPAIKMSMGPTTRDPIGIYSIRVPI